MIDILSYGLIIVGIVFWFWGTFPLIGNRSVLYKLHSLSISDTLGSMTIVVGLLLKIPSEWSLLLLAIITLAIWNTVLGYVLAHCSSDTQPSTISEEILSDD
ncbi:MAG: monovalent cation/H(+) antiporter subunit G [Cyanobacteria bacterium P01_G01_bin.19]